MIGRELGLMQYENTQIRVVEARLKDEEIRKFVPKEKDSNGTEIQWFAYVDLNLVAWAEMADYGHDSVWLEVMVLPQYRGVGLGKLMIRIATDLAIRYRKRAISVDMTSDPAVTAILEAEEFEEKKDVNHWRKELKWQ